MTEGSEGCPETITPESLFPPLLQISFVSRRPQPERTFLPGDPNPELDRIIETVGGLTDQKPYLTRMAEAVMRIGGEDYLVIDPSDPIEKIPNPRYPTERIKRFKLLGPENAVRQRYIRVQNSINQVLINQRPDLLAWAWADIQARKGVEARRSDVPPVAQLQQMARAENWPLFYYLDHLEENKAAARNFLGRKKICSTDIPRLAFRAVMAERGLPERKIDYANPLGEMVFRLDTPPLAEYIEQLNRMAAMAEEIEKTDEKRAFTYQAALTERIEQLEKTLIKTVLAADTYGECRLKDDERDILNEGLRQNNRLTAAAYSTDLLRIFHPTKGWRRLIQPRRTWRKMRQEKTRSADAWKSIIYPRLRELEGKESPFVISLASVDRPITITDDQTTRQLAAGEAIASDYKKYEEALERAAKIDRAGRLAALLTIPAAAAAFQTSEAARQAEVQFISAFWQTIGDLYHDRRLRRPEVDWDKAAQRTGNKGLRTVGTNAYERIKLSHPDLLVIKNEPPKAIEAVQPSDRIENNENPPQKVENCLAKEYEAQLSASLLNLYYQAGSFEFDDEVEFLFYDEVQEKCNQLAARLQKSSVMSAVGAASVDELNPEKMIRGTLHTHDQVVQELLSYYLSHDRDQDTKPIQAQESVGLEDNDFPLHAARYRLGYLYAEEVFDRLKERDRSGEREPDRLFLGNQAVKIINQASLLAFQKAEINQAEAAVYPQINFDLLNRWISSQQGNFSDQKEFWQFVSRAIEFHKQGEINMNLVTWFVDIYKYKTREKKVKGMVTYDFSIPEVVGVAAGATVAASAGVVKEQVGNQNRDLFAPRGKLSRRRFLQLSGGAAAAVAGGAAVAQLARRLGDPSVPIIAGLEKLNDDLWVEVERRLPRLNRQSFLFGRQGSIVLLAADGVTEIGQHFNQSREWVDLNNISSDLLKAVIATEDASFMEHWGVDVKGVGRAVLGRGKAGGGSTITQQLVRALAFTPEELAQEASDPSLRNKRKATEIVLALLFEKMKEEHYRQFYQNQGQPKSEAEIKKMVKADILQAYLNIAPFGANIYGVRAASKRYFGKEPAELSSGGATFLAGLPQSPVFYDPTRQSAMDQFGNPVSYGTKLPDGRFRLNEFHPGILRRSTVLQLMVNSGAIDLNTAQKLDQEPVDVNPIEGENTEYLQYVLNNLYQHIPSVVLTEGMRVETTLDPALQEKVTGWAREHLVDQINKGTGAREIGVVVRNARNGEVVAMVSLRQQKESDEEAEKQKEVMIENAQDTVTGSRPTGSMVKPVTYTEGFAQGRLQTNSTLNGDFYRIQNYGGARWGASVPWARALASSLNTAAQQVADRIGVLKLIEAWHKTGLKQKFNLDTVSTNMTLGSSEFTDLLALSEAYSALLNGGIKVGTTIIRQINSNIGSVGTQPVQSTVIYNSNPQSQQIFDQRAAGLVVQALSDDRNRPTFKNLNGGEGKFFAKSGTDTNPTNPSRPRTVGVAGGVNLNNKPYVVSVLMGTQDPQGMVNDATGTTNVAPLWRKITDYIVAEYQGPPA